MPKAEACPFCGNKDAKSHDSIWSYYVWCIDCGAHGPQKQTPELAINAWNQAAIRLAQARNEAPGG